MILRFVCTLMLTSFASCIAFCQPLQIRAGVNYSTIMGWRDMKAHGGFYAGIQKDFPLGGSKVSFQPGIFYSLQTAQYNPPTTANSTFKRYTRYSFHYLQVPMMFNFKVREHFGFSAGPQVGLLAYANEVIKDTSLTNEVVTARFNSLAVSLGDCTICAGR